MRISEGNLVLWRSRKKTRKFTFVINLARVEILALFGSREVGSYTGAGMNFITYVDFNTFPVSSKKFP